MNLDRKRVVFLVSSVLAIRVFTHPIPGRTPHAAPNLREVMTEVLLPSAPDVASQSTLFVAWGQLVTYDISLTVDNSSEPFDIPCDDGGGVADVWCPLGADSDAIPFFRCESPALVVEPRAYLS